MILADQKIRVHNSQHYGEYSNKVSFKGLSPEFLDKVGRAGANPATTAIASTVGYLLLRPWITMADKKTPEEERKFSALWQAGMTLAGGAGILAYNKKFENLGNFLSQKMLAHKLTAEELKLASGKSALIEAIHKAPETARKIINGTAEEAEALADKFDADLAKRSKPTIKSVLTALNPLNTNSKPAKDLFAESPGLVTQLHREASAKPGTMGKNLINNLIENKGTTKKILEVAGTSKVVHFVVLLSALNAITFLVTRYMKDITSFLGNKLNIGFLKDKDSKKAENEEKPKKKWSILDKGIFATLGALVGIEGLNIVGSLANKKKWGDQAVGSAAKYLNKHLSISKGFDKLINKTRSFINMGKGWLANQANINDKWVERSIITNTGMRSAILAPTVNQPGGVYNLLRTGIDGGLGLTLVNAADKAIVKPLSRGMSKLFGVKPYNEGIKVITDQGIKNIGIICLGLGFVINWVTQPIMKGLEKLGINLEKSKKLEEGYQEHRNRFMATQKLKQEQLFKGNPTNPFEKAKLLIKTQDKSLIS